MRIKDAVKIFIRNEISQKYLFMLRDNNPEILNPNMWAPLGGFIEDGETPLDAIARELKEETNVQVYDIECLGSVNSKHIDARDPDKKIESSIYICVGKTNTPFEESEFYEGQNLGYFSLEEIKQGQNFVPMVSKALQEFEINFIYEKF